MKPLSLEQRRIVRAKIQLLELFEALLARAGARERGKVMGWILKVYNRAPDLAEIHRVLGAVGSLRTIYDWQWRWRELGPAGLEDRRGRPRWSGRIDAQMKLFIEACILVNPALTSGQLRRIMAMKFKDRQLPGERAIRAARARIRAEWDTK